MGRYARVARVKEVWESIAGWEGYYEVSNYGRVKSLPRTTRGRWGAIQRSARIRKAVATRKGYMMVVLRLGDVSQTYAVAALVLEAFVGRRPEGMQACHKNHVRDDNRLSNLEWGTPSHNMREMAWADRCRGEKIKLRVADVLEIRKRLSRGERQYLLRREYGISSAQISRIAANKTWVQ